MAGTKDKILNHATHAFLLEKLYPQGRVISLQPVLVWECAFNPTPLSVSYDIRLEYRLGSQPEIYVFKARLQKGSADCLPHVYSTTLQYLCLHYPSERKWTSAYNIADTIVPWAAEWLFHYEIWLESGNWNGGGTTH